MNSKKAITLLVLATLIMGLIPVVSVHATIEANKIQMYDSDTKSWSDWDEPVKKGDIIRIVGDGVTAGATVDVYWDNAMKETFTDGSGKVASGTAKASGGFSIKFEVPEGVVGEHYIWVKDVATGNTASCIVNIAPKLTVSPSSGLKGDKITVKGYGFYYDEDVDTVITLSSIDSYFSSLISFTPSEPKTNSLGTFTATFTVPTTLGYGSYTIDAEDNAATPNSDSADFEVGASITLSASEGPVGSVVTISGRGFKYGDDVMVTIGEEPCYIISGESVRSDGRIRTKIVIPDKDLGTDDEPVKYSIQVQDAHENDPTAKFTVNGIAEIKATPSYGVQGAQITVEGWNFTRISGTEVLVTLGNAGDKTFKTDSNGYFKGTFQIPAVATGDNIPLKAEIEDHCITASSTVRVGVMIVILTPESGPSGALVSVTGVGFDDTETINVTIGDTEWFTTSSSDSTFNQPMNVPTLEPGIYPVVVKEEESEIEVTASFTVTNKTKVELNPMMAPNGYKVTVEGWYFAEIGEATDTSVEFILYNATSEWILPVTYTNLDADPEIDDETVVLGLDDDWDDGYFKGTFTVPDEDSIGLGTYTLNVTDGMGMFAQITFQVVPKTTQITPKKATFRIGETVAFNVQSSFKQENAYIKIYDPDGNQYWKTDPFAEKEWTKVGEVQVYPFYEQTAGGNQMVLLEDAPLGTYTWEWYDADDELLDEGVFNVAASPADVLTEQVEDLNEAMAELSDEISTVSDAVAGVKSDVAGAIAAANAAVEAANAALEAVNAAAAQSGEAAQAAQNAADAAAEAQDAASGLTTLVYGAIGASLVAALAAIVSLMQISRRIAG